MHHLGCSSLPAADLRSINRWMSHQNTAPPVQLAIMRSLKAWIAGEPILPFSGITTDKLDRLTALAHTEQSLIGWAQVFKGRLSKKWTLAQGTWYDHMRHNLPSSEKFPKRYTGPIWMKKLVAQLIFYNLNRWQIRNEAAHATESAEEYRKIRERHQSTITALYQRHSEEPDTHALYTQPLEDILNMPNDRLVNWLQSHSASSAYRAQQHQDTPSPHTQHLIQQDLHTFIRHETER